MELPSVIESQPLFYYYVLEFYACLVYQSLCTREFNDHRGRHILQKHYC